jgi:Rieske Fe-S protein
MQKLPRPRILLASAKRTEILLRRWRARKTPEEGPVGGRRISRKKLLRVGAVISAGAVGAAVLAGCRDGGSAPALTLEESTGRVPEATSRQADIADVSDVAPNSAVSYTNVGNGLPEVLVRLPDGRFVGYSAVCSHQGCTVAYRPQIRKLVCPCHGGVYDPARGGAVVSGPPPLPLAKVKIEVRNGKVFRVRLLRPDPQQRS